MKKELRRGIAGLLSVAVLASAAAVPCELRVNASAQLLGETTFDYKALPWHTCESSPAKQNFELDDGTFHVQVLVPQGDEKEKWDLQFRHRNLNFIAGHTYEIDFQ